MTDPVLHSTQATTHLPTGVADAGCHCAASVSSGAMDLLARLGGPPNVRGVTDALYDRLLADDEIGPLFGSTHMPEMRRRLADYLLAACVGEASVPATRLRAAHADQQVNDRHFSIMAGHLADLLLEMGVDDDAAADLLDLVARRRGDVVSHSRVVDEWAPFDETI